MCLFIRYRHLITTHGIVVLICLQKSAALRIYTQFRGTFVRNLLFQYLWIWEWTDMKWIIPNDSGDTISRSSWRETEIDRNAGQQLQLFQSCSRHCFLYKLQFMSICVTWNSVTHNWAVLASSSSLFWSHVPQLYCFQFIMWACWQAAASL